MNQLLNGYWDVHGKLVSKLAYNQFRGLISYLYGGYNPITKYHGHPSRESPPLNFRKIPYSVEQLVGVGKDSFCPMDPLDLSADVFQLLVEKTPKFLWVFRPSYDVILENCYMI